MVPETVQTIAACWAKVVSFENLHAQSPLEGYNEERRVDLSIVLDYRSGKPRAGPGQAAKTNMCPESCVTYLRLQEVILERCVQKLGQLFLAKVGQVTFQH